MKNSNDMNNAMTAKSVMTPEEADARWYELEGEMDALYEATLTEIAREVNGATGGFFFPEPEKASERQELSISDMGRLLYFGGTGSPDVLVELDMEAREFVFRFYGHYKELPSGEMGRIDAWTHGLRMMADDRDMQARIFRIQEEAIRRREELQAEQDALP